MTRLVFIFSAIFVLGAQPPIPKNPATLPVTEYSYSYDDTDTLLTMTTRANPQFSSLMNSENQLLTFTLRSDVSIVNEDAGPTTVTVTAELNSGTPYNTEQTLEITVTGSGQADAVDFEDVSNFNIVVAANANSGSASFTLTPVNDQVDEVNETITIASTSSLVSSAATPITLQDDDAPPTGISLRSNTNAIFEEDGEQEITIFAEILSPTTYATEQVIPVTVTGTQAQGVVKFAPVAGFNITLPAETASTSRTFTITPENNLIDEENETITVASTAPFVIGSAMINLIDDDPTPSITLTASPSSVGESNSPTRVTISANWDSQIVFPADQRIPLTVAGSGTAPAVDFVPVPDFDLTIPQGASGGAATFILSPIDDSEDEVNETITISSTSALVGESATVVLEDDDDAPGNIRLAAAPSEIGEGDGATSVTVTATIGNGTTFAETTVFSIDVAGSGDDNVVGFSSVSGLSIDFAPGTSMSTTTLELVPIDDNKDTDDEIVTLSSTDPSITGSATIRLLDDDDAPIILLSANPNSVSENDGETTITVTATLQNLPSLEEDQTLPITVSGSGRVEAVDFIPVQNFDLVLNAGTSTASATFILIPQDDSQDELDEIITIASTQTFVTNSPTVVLLDDDETPSISFSATPSSIREDGGATEISVTAVVNGSTQFSGTQVLPVTVRGSGMTEAVDFLPVPDFDLVLNAGTSTASATFILIPQDDSQDELDEIITIASTQTFVTNSPTVVLLDDDETPSISFSATPSSIREDGGATEISVTAVVNGSTQFSGTQVLPVTVRGSGMTEAVDFLPVPDFDLVLNAGASTASTTFTLTPLNDSEDEADESVLIESSNSLVTNSTTVIILDDDDPGQVQLSVTPMAVYEENGTQTVTVTGTITSGQVFSQDRIIPLSVRGSGQPNVVDFEPIAVVDLVFKADLLTAAVSFDVTPIDDLEFESDETLTVSSADAIIDAPVVIQLINDDERPEGITLTTSPESIREDAGTTTVTVTASVQGNTRYTTSRQIPLTITNSGEPNSVQYLPITGAVLTIPPGEAKGSVEFEITPVNNDIHQPNGMITIGSESDLVLGTTRIRLKNDDAEPTGITISLNPTIIAEDAGKTEVTLTVHVTGSTRYGVDKTLTLEGMGSGMPGVVGFSLTLPPALSLPAGDESASTTFLVEPVDNLLDEHNETLTITAEEDDLRATAELSVTDDDAAPGGFELAITPEIIIEGDGPTTVKVTATLAGDTRYATTQTLDLSVAGPTIGAVSFESIPDFQIEVPVGAESGDSRFILTPVQNTIPETDATVTITAVHMGTTIRATLLLQDDDEATKRAADANAILLPEAIRAIIASSVGAVQERIRVFRNGTSVQTSGFSNGLSRVAMRLQNDQPQRYPVNAQWASQLNQASLATSIKERLTVWAYADYRSLSSNSNDSPLRYDGNITGLHGGIDLSFGRLLVGLSVSQFGGALDYEHRGGSTNRLALMAPVEGLYQINARMLTPYINWSWRARSGVWAMASFSSGEVEISDPELALEKANTSLDAFAAGVDLGLITAPGGFSLALKGAAWGGQMNLDENASRISGLDVGVSRFQIFLEGAYRIRLTDRGLLQPFVETGLRSDGGDGQTGTGLEMGGGARLSLPSAGLQITGRGQVLVLHGGNIDEWAFSGMLRYAPGGNTGPNLELHSSTGERFGNFQEIWQDTRWLARHKHRIPGIRLRSRLGYRLNVNRGSIMPYTGIELRRGVATQMGAEYRIGSQLSIRMEAAYHMQSSLHQSSPTVRALVLLR